MTPILTPNLQKIYRLTEICIESILEWQKTTSK
nr:MAG TPA: hypothetical protein [Caudoviricetes sp.]